MFAILVYRTINKARFILELYKYASNKCELCIFIIGIGVDVVCIVSVVAAAAAAAVVATKLLLSFINKQFYNHSVC